MTSFDAIVIGGGHNGLVAAATLGKTGRNVLVLEADSETGGSARTEEFAPAFEAAVVSGRAALIELRMDPEMITTRTTLSAPRRQAETAKP